MNQQGNKTPGREFALKFLFQLFIKENAPLKDCFYSNSIEDADFDEQLMAFKESYVQPDEEHPENNIDDGNFFFAQKLLRSLMKNVQGHEDLIKEELKRDHLEALEKVERSTLLIGVEELTQFDTPYQVVINELVGLAKKYGGEKSGQFVNGVLDGIRAKKC